MPGPAYGDRRFTVRGAACDHLGGITSPSRAAEVSCGADSDLCLLGGVNLAMPPAVWRPGPAPGARPSHFHSVPSSQFREHCCAGDLGHEILVNGPAAAGTLSLDHHSSTRRSSTCRFRNSSDPASRLVTSPSCRLCGYARKPSPSPFTIPAAPSYKWSGSSPASVQMWGPRVTEMEGHGCDELDTRVP